MGILGFPAGRKSATDAGSVNKCTFLCAQMFPKVISQPSLSLQKNCLCGSELDFRLQIFAPERRRKFTTARTLSAARSSPPGRHPMVRGAAGIPGSIGNAQSLAEPVFRAWPRAKRRILLVNRAVNRKNHVCQRGADLPLFSSACTRRLGDTRASSIRPMPFPTTTAWSYRGHKRLPGGPVSGPFCSSTPTVRIESS